MVTSVWVFFYVNCQIPTQCYLKFPFYFHSSYSQIKREYGCQISYIRNKVAHHIKSILNIYFSSAFAIWKLRCKYFIHFSLFNRNFNQESDIGNEIFKSIPCRVVCLNNELLLKYIIWLFICHIPPYLIYVYPHIFLIVIIISVSFSCWT